MPRMQNEDSDITNTGADIVTWQQPEQQAQPVVWNPPSWATPVNWQPTAPQPVQQPVQQPVTVIPQAPNPVNTLQRAAASQAAAQDYFNSISSNIPLSAKPTTPQQQGGYQYATSYAEPERTTQRYSGAYDLGGNDRVTLPTPTPTPAEQWASLNRYLSPFVQTVKKPRSIIDEWYAAQQQRANLAKMTGTHLPQDYLDGTQESDYPKTRWGGERRVYQNIDDVVANPGPIIKTTPAQASYGGGGGAAGAGKVAMYSYGGGGGGGGWSGGGSYESLPRWYVDMVTWRI